MLRALGLVVGCVMAGLLVSTWIFVITSPDYPGIDWFNYREAALRWLSTGQFYYDFQLAGPYRLSPPAVLYPPTAIPLFLVMAPLPDALWWAIPLGIAAAVIVSNRPGPWTWAAIFACFLWPWSVVTIEHGTPTIWILAFVALGTRWPAFFALVLLKPSVFPFALLGLRSRAWWVAMVALAAVSLVFWPLWRDWYVAITNGYPGGLLYSSRDAPMLITPLLPLLARRVSGAGEWKVWAWLWRTKANALG